MILILLCSVFATIFLAVAWNCVKCEPDEEPQKRNTTTTVREEPHRWTTPNIDAEANWQECKRQIDYSLYVTHDWDIFKNEEDK